MRRANGGVCSAIEHFDFENRMHLPRRRAPGMMITIVADRLNVRADVGRTVVIVIPQQISGQPNFFRRMSRWFVSQIWPTHETGDIGAGTDPGAPRLTGNAILTTLISVVVFAALVAFADYAGGFSHLLTRRVDAATPTTLLKERVAQLVEHLTFNQEVMGSNPIALTNKIS